MSFVRFLARSLLAGIFVTSGYNNVRKPQGPAALAEPAVKSVADALGVEVDTELLVRANAATMLGAGTTMALGIFPRLSALALAATLVPTTLAGHRFWAESDPKARALHRLQVLKNAGLLGGLLLVASEPKRRN